MGELDQYNPNFHLQPNERIVRVLKAKKLGISGLLFIILCMLTLGIFLFFWRSFRRVKAVKVIVLTNYRVMEWEYTLSGNPKIIQQESYELSGMTYYQYELVQDQFTCWGLCKARVWTTMRIFFSRFPDGVPPSYNKAQSIMPIVCTLLKVAGQVKDAVMHGIMHNPLGVLKALGHLFMSLFKLFGQIFRMLVRPEQYLPGHYIELDTDDDGSVEKIQQFIGDLLNFYPRHNMLQKPPHPDCVTAGDGPLWESKEGPVFLNPRYLQLGQGEVILDAIPHPVKITLWDWFKCVITFGLYYFFVVKDLLNYKGALLVTDRRFISIFAHNLYGFKPDVKYIQMTNSWFFRKFGSAAISTSKPRGLCSCCEDPSRTLMFDCGSGSLSITPSVLISKERAYEFFSQFFGYLQPPVVDPAQFPHRSGRFRDGLLLPGEEVLSGISYVFPPRTGCCYCGPISTTTLLCSTHRLSVHFDVSDCFSKEYLTYDLYTPLRYVTAFELGEAVHSVCFGCCGCCKRTIGKVGVSLGRSSHWDFEFRILNLSMDDQEVQHFANVMAFAQNCAEHNSKVEWQHTDIEIVMTDGASMFVNAGPS